MTKFGYALLFYGIVVLMGYLCVKVKNRKEPIAGKLFWLIFVATWTIFAYAVSMSTNEIFVMSVCHSIVFANIDFMMLFFIAYALEYTTGKSIPAKYFYPLLGLVGLDSFSLLSNPWHEQTLTYGLEYKGNDIYFIYQPKLLYELHLVFCYLMVVAVLVILIYKCVRVPFMYSWKYLSVLGAFLITILLNFVFLFEFVQFDFDISIFTYALLGCMIYYLTFVYKRSGGMIRTIRNMAIDKIDTPIVLFDNDSSLIDFNKRAQQTFGFMNDHIGQLTKSYFEKSILHLEHYSLSGMSTQEEIRLLDGDGEVWYQISHYYLQSEWKYHFGDLYVFHDVTEQKVMYQSLEKRASYDTLTGLYNNHTFFKKLEAFESEYYLPISIAICNIHGLKLINDIFGHDMGDRVLQYIAKYWSKAISSEDLLARFDGDEMVLLLPKQDEKEATQFLEEHLKKMQERAKFDFEIHIEYGISTSYNQMSDLREHVIKARNEMLRKIMLHGKTMRLSFIDTLKKMETVDRIGEKVRMEELQQLAYKFGKQLQLGEEQQKELEQLVLLHDIGMLSIPKEILQKQESMTANEWELVKLHTVHGYQIAEGIKELSSISNDILCHHERYDGKGYPTGLHGEEIPYLARVFAVLDAYTVMIHKQENGIYITSEQACKEIKRCAGTQFDPNIAKVFCSMFSIE